MGFWIKITGEKEYPFKFCDINVPTQVKIKGMTSKGGCDITCPVFMKDSDGNLESVYDVIYIEASKAFVDSEGQCEFSK
jgi:hypothetical protein